MNEIEVDLNRRISENITDPYVALCAAVVFRAILDCKAQPGKSTWAKANRDLANAKLGAIDFIKRDIDFWIDISGLKINPLMIREILASELEKREEMNAIIAANLKGYPKKRKKVPILNCKKSKTC